MTWYLWILSKWKRTPQNSSTEMGFVNIGEIKAFTAKQLNGNCICGYCQNESKHHKTAQRKWDRWILQKMKWEHFETAHLLWDLWILQTWNKHTGKQLNGNELCGYCQNDMSTLWNSSTEMGFMDISKIKWVYCETAQRKWDLWLFPK